MVASKPALVQGYLIGQAAAMSGLSAANIRFYEGQGLVALRTSGTNGYRLYGPAEIGQLRFLRLLRSMDMSLDEMRALMGLDWRRKADCAAARATLDLHIGHVRERLAELRALDRQLHALRARCDGTGPACGLIEALHAQARQAPPRPAPRRRTAHV